MAKQNISDELLAMLNAADKRTGLPPGTMQSIMQQETGGNSKYINDPTSYHYGLNAEGRRVAGHTGKISTAFGPFGILESTAADPGFGIAPLKDKTSLEEQIRFASDYAAKRGLANYGEGAKYAQQVTNRRDGGNVAGVTPNTTAPSLQEQAQESLLAGGLGEQNSPQPSPLNPVDVQRDTFARLIGGLEQEQVNPEVDGWDKVKQATSPAMAANAMNYGPGVVVPNFDVRMASSNVPNFRAFKQWSGSRNGLA